MSSDADARLLHRVEFEAGTSNTVILSKSEAIAAKRFTSNAERNLQALELQIAELGRQIIGFVRQREPDMAQLERLRTAMAPHKCLPAELLSYIFRLSTEDEPIKIPRDPHPTPPWTLRQVCSRWRNIALYDRNLWSSIAVSIGPFYGYGIQEILDREKVVDLLAIILPKTGPISISIKVHGVFKEVADTLIRPYSSRVVDLCVALPGDKFHTFYTMLPNQFNSLESLKLEFLSPGFHGHRITALPENLHMLTISGDNDIYSISSEQINWDNITHLDLSGTFSKFSEVFTILHRCKNLKMCSIDVHGCNSGPPGQHISLLYLNCFNVVFDDAAIFDAFTLPSLTELIVENQGLLFSATEITSMIHRSGCELEDLSHYYIGRQALQCNFDALAALLTAVPSLQTLSISEIMVSKAILERIGNGELLPHLEELESRLDVETQGMFLDAVERRLLGNPSIASNGTLTSALGVYPKELHLTDDTEALVHRASHLNTVYKCDVRIIPST